MEDPEQVRPGRWRIKAAEYDAAAYSNAVQADPSTPDSNLPDVGPPSAVTGLTLTEDNIQTQNGDYASRIKIAWTASTSAFVTAYQVTVTKGATVVYSAETRDTSATTPPVAPFQYGAVILPDSVTEACCGTRMTWKVFRLATVVASWM